MRVLNFLVTAADKGEGRHCCDAMTKHVALEEQEIQYNPHFREYRVLDTWERSESIAMEQIAYCPWCGTKLPEILRDAWFDRLDELGIEEPDDPAVPEEMFTDTWWRKTGL